MSYITAKRDKDEFSNKLIKLLKTKTVIKM